MSLADKFRKCANTPPKLQSQDDQQNQQNQRVVGLQRGQQVQTLLKTIKGRPITKPMVNTPVAKPAMVRDSASPLSVSSGDDEQLSRADIRPTTFTSKTNPASSDSAAPRSIAQSTNEKTRSSARIKSDTKSQPSSLASRRRSKDEDVEDFPSNRKRKSPSQERQESSHNSTDMFGQKIRPKFPPSNTYKSGQATIRRPKLTGRLITKDETSPKKQGLGIPEGSPGKEEIKSSPKKGLYIPARGDSPPTKGSPLREGLKELPGRKRSKIEVSPEESRPKFIIPALLPNMKEEDFDDLELTGVSTIDVISRSLSPLTDIDSAPVCPMCNEEVDEAVLEKFKKIHPGPRMTLRQEQLFCVFHKKKTAEKIWRKKRYPEIEWDRLDKRIAKHYKFLRAILEGGESHYGNIFSQKIKSGQNRTLLKSEDDLNLSPGYYGTRGLRVMTDNLTWKFSALLRERSVKDRLVSARGHTAYVQAVLIPELAVQLIKGDMGVDVEKARVIMEESISVGELLSEEVGDVVLESDESDESDQGM